jgi:hypothetical protein
MMKNILVCGDSFCANYDKKYSWTNILAELLNVNVKSVGIRGCSNYLIYNQFLKFNSDEYDYVIVIKTAESRIPIVNKHPHMCATLDWKKINFDRIKFKNYEKALEYYYYYYYDLDFVKWTSYNAFRSIENLQLKNQKIIWINAFESSYVHEKKANNIIVNGYLSYVSTMSIDNKHITNYHGDHDINGSANHLSPIDNHNLAIFLKELINDNNGNNDLNKHNWSWM